jgi:hypothetical protein
MPADLLYDEKIHRQPVNSVTGGKSRRQILKNNTGILQ